MTDPIDSRTALQSRPIRIAIAGTLVAALLAGCAGSGGHLASAAAPTATKAGKDAARGVVRAEAAVARSPQDAALRLSLANAYLAAGRFESAATTYNDAMDLGDNGARTALALALSEVAAGRSGEAVAILDDWRDSIPASDLGLAYALAGQTARGVTILSDSLRGGDDSPKLRQNLAYAYALDGRWQDARVMVAQDVPAGEIDTRISDWAMMGKPEDARKRVAALLSVPMIADPGQPAQLALQLAPAAEQAVAEAAIASPMPEPAVAAAPAGELPAAAELVPAIAMIAPVAPEPAPATATPASFSNAFADQRSAEVASSTAVVTMPGRVSRPVVTRTVASRATPPRAVVAGGSHLVQLGAFSSPQGARRAWGVFVARNAELRNYRMTITPAVVRGQNFWRVAAAGFNSRRANGLCSTVKGRGGACFAYAAITPPAQSPNRMAGGPQLASRR